MFGQFKTNLGDEFTAANAKKMSQYFDLSPAKQGDIEQSKRPGIELLTILENDSVIGEDIGISELSDALKFCSLNRLARVAENTYTTLKKKGVDTPDTAPVYTGQNVEQLKTTLQVQLTRQQCSEVAMFLGLPASFIETIQSSRNPGEELVQILNDRQIIKESNIGLLVIALRARGLHRVASIVTNKGEISPPVHGREHQAVAVSESSVVSQESTKREVISRCLCGNNEFEELISLSGEMVSIQCRSPTCKLEWLRSDTPGNEISLLRNDIKFFYKIPLTIEESKLVHETVTDINALKPGDHIVMRRYGIWDHHAIFIFETSKKMKVIHWTTNFIDKLRNRSNEKVKYAEIKYEYQKFPKEIKRVCYPKEDPPHLVIARAHKLYEDKEQHHYSLTDNNCETLATYCKIGKGFSMQAGVVKDVLPPVQRFIKSFTKGFEIIFQ